MARTVVAVLAAAVIGAMAAAHAQTQGPTSAQDILPALLEEVRGLRAAMEAMSSAGARVQLALGRLQLQEQRLATAIKRLDDTRSKLSDLQRQQAEHHDQVAALETTAREATVAAGAGGVGVATHGDRPTAEQLEEMKTHFRRMVERMTTDIQRLMAEEAMLATDVAGEQARWTEMNQRLEDLERSLNRR
jgi:DNA repair exonuclease SbcCD ATPase subunit